MSYTVIGPERILQALDRLIEDLKSDDPAVRRRAQKTALFAERYGRGPSDLMTPYSDADIKATLDWFSKLESGNTPLEPQRKLKSLVPEAPADQAVPLDPARLDDPERLGFLADPERQFAP